MDLGRFDAECRALRRHLNEIAAEMPPVGKAAPDAA
jgi:hypothetical protein